MWNDGEWLFVIHKTEEEGPVLVLPIPPNKGVGPYYVRKEDYGIWDTTVGHLHFPKELC